MKTNPTILDVENKQPLTFPLKETTTNPEQRSGFSLVNHELPAVLKCPEIISTLEHFEKIVVEGSTGSGKSTQIPLAFAEMGYKVYVAQPRVLAARELALFLRSYLTPIIGEEKATNFVGYSTGQESNEHPDNRIVFTTDGKLRRQLLQDDFIEDYDRTLVIADEVHEMTPDTELLVGTTMLKKDLKTIYQSASCDTERISGFVGSHTDQEEVPIISIEGTLHKIDEEKGGLMSDEVARHADEGKVVLGFVDTVEDVNKMIGIIKGKLKNSKIAVLPLYGELDDGDQRKVFNNYPEGKIIIATSVAETSITIPDVDVVVDGGHHRTNGIDSNAKRELPLKTITRDKAEQRRGRCGRTKPGKYIMAQQDGRDFIDWDDIEAYCETALGRSHLSSSILSFLGSSVINWDSIPKFSTINPEVERQHLDILRSLGAIASDGTATEIGIEMKAYPVDHPYARMLVESQKYSPEVQLQLAAAVSATEASGILRSSIKKGEVDELTDDLSDSILMTNLSIFLASQTYDDKELKNLGIVPKKLHRAKAKLQVIKDRMGIQDIALTKPTEEQREQLLSCIVSGSEEIFVARNRFTTVDNNGAVVRLGPSQREMGGPKALILGYQLGIQRPNSGFNSKLLGATSVTVENLLEWAPDRCGLIPLGIRFNRSGTLVGDFEVTFDGTRTKNTVSREITASEDTLDMVIDYILYEPQSSKFSEKAKEIQDIVDFMHQLSLKSSEGLEVDDAVESIRTRLAAALSSGFSRCEDLDKILPKVKVTEYFDNETIQATVTNAPDGIEIEGKRTQVRYEGGTAMILLPRKTPIPTKATLKHYFGDRNILLKVPRLAGGYRTHEEIIAIDSAPSREERRSIKRKPTTASTKTGNKPPGDYHTVTSKYTAMSALVNR